MLLYKPLTKGYVRNKIVDLLVCQVFGIWQTFLFYSDLPDSFYLIFSIILSKEVFFFIFPVFIIFVPARFRGCDFGLFLTVFLA